MRKPASCQCGVCLSCRQREYQRLRRIEQPEHMRYVEQAYRERNRKRIREQQKRWRDANRELIKQRSREIYEPKRKREWEPSEKTHARNVLNSAVRYGKITPKPCERCGADPKRHNGSSDVHAHHDDYSKPLDVRWLCAECHIEYHKEHPR